MRSIREVLKKAAHKLLESQNSNSPILDAELLLLYALDQSGMAFNRTKLLTQSQYLIDENIADEYMNLIEERCKGKPVQYITNRQEFMGLDFFVAEGVLIPRADTETVVEKVLEKASGMEKPNIIDMCTGSGAIAVSLAENIPDARVWAADISGSALNCCGINVRRYGFEGRIKVIKSDLFENIREEGLQDNTDIIVANPPYIESEAIRELDVNVRDYEPHLALDGGKDGLVYYRRIVNDSVEFLKIGGILAFEVGYDQGGKVREIMKDSGHFYDIKIEKDLSGYDRCVWGRKTIFGE